MSRFDDKLFDAIKPKMMERLEGIPLVENSSDMAFTTRPVRYKCCDAECGKMHVGLQLRIVRVTEKQRQELDAADDAIVADGSEVEVASAIINAHRLGDLFGCLIDMGEYATKLADLMVVMQMDAKEKGH